MNCQIVIIVPTVSKKGAAIHVVVVESVKIPRFKQWPTNIGPNAAGQLYDRVHDVNLVTGFKKVPDEAAADETGAAGDKNLTHDRNVSDKAEMRQTMMWGCI